MYKYIVFIYETIYLLLNFCIECYKLCSHVTILLFNYALYLFNILTAVETDAFVFVLIVFVYCESAVLVFVLISLV